MGEHRLTSAPRLGESSRVMYWRKGLACLSNIGWSPRAPEWLLPGLVDKLLFEFCLKRFPGTVRYSFLNSPDVV